MPTLRFFRLITPALFVATLLAALALLAVLAGGKAEAEPLVCVSVQYKLPGDDPEQLINNCYVSTSWQGGIEDSECGTDPDDPLRHNCYQVKIALPV